MAQTRQIPLIVAVDGPAASGKGTLARRLAEALRLPYLDTGLLYRAVGRLVLDAGADPANAMAAEMAAHGLRAEDLARADLRGPNADRAASVVAVHSGVRSALVNFQRAFGRTSGAVLDGRDIGTAIFPEAPVKLFVTASDAVRAHRRWLELMRRNEPATLEQVAADMAARDARDRGRAAAPLRPAEDAVVLDTTELTPDQVLAQALAAVRRAIPDRA